MILDRINGPEDIKKVPPEELGQLAQEIREFLIRKISERGGHLASNLGVVELTMALYRVFSPPADRFIWDVGHQSYTHKILSGRKKEFDGLRLYGGMSGFPKQKENPCDAFDTGHSSTSISVGIGMAEARALRGEDYSIVSIIGDGALTGGMAYEALNNAARLKQNFIIVLNDNRMSISENVGGMSAYLNSLRTGKGYIRLKESVADALMGIPKIGQPLIQQIKNTKNGIKQLLIPGMLFENMGITYLGPVDGHDIRRLERVLLEAKRLNHAVIVHVLTRKGCGYGPAERHPDRYHGVGPFDIATGKPKKKKEHLDYTDVFSRKLIRIAEKDPSIVAVTAAMPDGTGLTAFRKHFPDRFFDVGIAEQHAVTSAAGLAAGGMRPVVVVYSSFLQRGFDQVVHDVCLQNLPVVFAIDRAGLVGADGETHQGIFDLSFLSCIPNMTVMAPKNRWELEDMLDLAFTMDGPCAIRYPRGQAYRGLKQFRQKVEPGKGEILYLEPDAEIALLALGSMVSTAEHIREKLMERGIPCTLANARFAKPLDKELLGTLARTHKVVVSLEENVFSGGFGSMVSDALREISPETGFCHINLPDAYVEHGDVSRLREQLSIDSDSVLRIILARFFPEKADGEDETGRETP